MAEIPAKVVQRFNDDRFIETNLRAAVSPVLEDSRHDAMTAEEAVRRAMEAPSAE
jgi:hypothetical protein